MKEDIRQVIGEEYLNKLDIERFAHNQFIMYELVQSVDSIHKLFENCYRDNIHSIWANQELYRPKNSREEFYNILEKNMRPVYDSARRQGYQVWEKVTGALVKNRFW